jgi:uncharacterized RDD family membrane protein YckC
MQDLVETKTVNQPPPPSGWKYASFSRRATAFSIDQVILWCVIMIFVIPATILIGLASMIAWPFVFIIFTPAVMPVTSIIAWLYFALQESSRHHGTFGKRMCGLHVTDMQGQPINFQRASVRFFCKFISAVFMLAGFIMAAFTEKHQALHDLIADTLVLRKVKS